MDKITTKKILSTTLVSSETRVMKSSWHYMFLSMTNIFICNELLPSRAFSCSSTLSSSVLPEDLVGLFLLDPGYILRSYMLEEIKEIRSNAVYICCTNLRKELTALASFFESLLPSLLRIFCMSSIFWRTASAVLEEKTSFSK